MFYNNQPEKNIGFIPQIRKLLEELEHEGLAMEPLQLNLNIDGGREMKTKEVCGTCTHVGRVKNDTTGMECLLGDFPVSYSSKCQHSDSEYISIASVAKAEDESIEKDINRMEEEMLKKEEVPREVQSRSLLHHKVGVCPQCEGDMYIVSTKKAFGKSNQACTCESCNYSENR